MYYPPPLNYFVIINSHLPYRGYTMADDWFDSIIKETDWEAVDAAFQQFKKDSQFLNANRDQWRVAYPDQWVAVFQEELVAVGDTLPEVLRQAEEHNVAPYRVALEYLPHKPIGMILFGGRA